jgi:hypothetical protein
MMLSLSLSCLNDPLAERFIYCARLSVLERAEFKTLLQDIMPEEGRTFVVVASSPPPEHQRRCRRLSSSSSLMLCAQCNSRAAFKSLLPDMNQQRRRGVPLSSDFLKSPLL